MKGRNTGQAKSREDEGAQLVLIGGLLIAVAIISIAVVIGGGLFSQSTNDDGGLSSFASQTADRIQAATQVGQQDLVYVNKNSTLFRGAYPSEICGELVNSTEVQQLVSTQLGEGESVVGLEVEEDCGDDKSWLVGQKNPNYELPSVNSTSPGGTTAVTCGDLNEDTGFDDSSVQQAWIDQLVENNGGDVPENVTASEKKKALEDIESSTALNLDPIRDFDGLDLLEYAESCTSYEVTQGRAPVDVVFAIDTTGSMGDPSVYEGDFVRGSWQTPPHGGVFPSEDLTSTHRPDTGVTIPDGWIDIRCATTVPCDWSGGSSGDIVFDNNKNRIARVTSDSPTEITQCFPGYGCFVVGEKWDVEYQNGDTAQVPEDDLFSIDYRLYAPERMWFTQKGMKAAVDDLNRSEPDRAGLIGYDTDQTEEAGVAGIDDASHRQKLKVETDKFVPEGGTDIAGGLDKAKDILERDYGNGPDASLDATKHIVLMTDGRDNEGQDPVDYIQDNQDEFKNTYIHSVILGSTAANNLDAVSDMAVLANDPNPDLSGSGIDESDLPDTTPDRPNGTLIVSEDPSDAKGIFEDVVGSIEATAGSNSNATAGVSNPGKTFTSSTTTNTGKVNKIYDVRMNVSDFEGNGTYRMKFVGVDSSGDEELVWSMVVDNKFIGPGSPPSNHGLGYEVRFRSQVDDDLNQTLTVPKNVDPSVFANTNLSDPGEYVWLDLTGKGSKPRLDIGGLSPSETQDELGGTSPDDYIQNAWQKIRNEAENDEGVDIVMEHRGPNGPNPPLRRGEVRGTFSMEFEPKNGNFTKIGQITGGNFTDDCDTANAPDLPSRCGLKDPGNNRSAVSTTLIKEAKITVKVRGPEGVSERVIKIPPKGRFRYDIFE